MKFTDVVEYSAFFGLGLVLGVSWGLASQSSSTVVNKQCEELRYVKPVDSSWVLVPAPTAIRIIPPSGGPERKPEQKKEEGSCE